MKCSNCESTTTVEPAEHFKKRESEFNWAKANSQFMLFSSGLFAALAIVATAYGHREIAATVLSISMLMVGTSFVFRPSWEVGRAQVCPHFLVLPYSRKPLPVRLKGVKQAPLTNLPLRGISAATLVQWLSAGGRPNRPELDTVFVVLTNGRYLSIGVKSLGDNVYEALRRILMEASKWHNLEPREAWRWMLNQRLIARGEKPLFT